MWQKYNFSAWRRVNASVCGCIPVGAILEYEGIQGLSSKPAMSRQRSVSTNEDLSNLQTPEHSFEKLIKTVRVRPFIACSCGYRYVSLNAATFLIDMEFLGAITVRVCLYLLSLLRILTQKDEYRFLDHWLYDWLTDWLAHSPKYSAHFVFVYRLIFLPVF